MRSCLRSTRHWKNNRVRHRHWVRRVTEKRSSRWQVNSRCLTPSQTASTISACKWCQHQSKLQNKSWLRSAPISKTRLPTWGTSAATRTSEFQKESGSKDKYVTKDSRTNFWNWSRNLPSSATSIVAAVPYIAKKGQISSRKSPSIRIRSAKCAKILTCTRKAYQHCNRGTWKWRNGVQPSPAFPRFSKWTHSLLGWRKIMRGLHKRFRPLRETMSCWKATWKTRRRSFISKVG